MIVMAQAMNRLALQSVMINSNPRPMLQLQCNVAVHVEEGGDLEVEGDLEELDHLHIMQFK